MGDGLAIRSSFKKLRYPMLRNARTWIAVSVIAGGITAAVVLPKSATETAAPDRPSGDALIRRDFDFDEAIARAHAEQAPQAVTAPGSTIEGSQAPGTSPLDLHNPPPRLDDEIPSDGAVGEHRLSQEVFQDLARRPVEGEPGSSEPIRYKIVDGDTLRTIAKRYLGDSERFMEIFEANRDLLRSPGVLPIGAELVIPVGGPPRPAVAAQRVEASTVSVGQVVPQANSASQPVAQDAAPMVEIPPGTLRSVPAESAQSTRTYRVREGDTLVSIARRLYGDGRKYRDIFDANREQLTTPNALPTGVLLVIP